MKLDHSEVVLGFEGQPILDKDESGATCMVTFRTLAVFALTNELPDERMGAETKAKAFALTTKFFRGKTVDLTLDERSLIKERAGKVCNTRAFGRLSEWLEGTPQFVALPEDDAEEPAPKSKK